MQSSQPPIRIIHYNDVYNIDVAPREPVGGAARFVTAITQAIHAHHGETLVLFSGDAFSPAPLTSITKGDEMPPILNATKIDVACIGNHELDNGLHVMKQRISETNFPWILSNVFENSPTPSPHPKNLLDHQSYIPIGGIHCTHTLTRAGLKFGFMGLAAYDWLATLDKLSVDDVVYVDFCEAARKVAHQLRNLQKCDFVIALTHMRLPDDQLLAQQVPDVDLILGGHDHILSKKLVNGRWIVKSGSDFKNFSTIDLYVGPEGKLRVEEPIHYSVTSEYTEHPEIAPFVAAKLKLLGNASLLPLALSTTDLDGRFVSIRTQETGLGNFVSDIMAHHMGADIGLINAGSFRSDSIEPPGKITQQAINAILPFKDQVVLVTCTGHEIVAILENSVSQYPLLDGRFCQISGLLFSFDAQKPAGMRIDRSSVLCKNESGVFFPLEDNKEFSCAVKTYIFSGKDGFPKGDQSNILKRSEIHISDMVSMSLTRYPLEETLGIPIISPTVEGRIKCINPSEELQRTYMQ